MTFHIFHRHRVCLADCVDLIRSLYSWWEGYRSSLATLPLGFNCGFISTSTCGLSTGVCSWGCPGGLGFAPVRARCGRSAPAWVTGFRQLQVLRGVGSQGSRKYNALEGHGNQYWPIHSSVLAWRSPSLTEKPGRPQSTGSQRVEHNQSDPACIDARLFFACGCSASVRDKHEGDAAAWLVGTWRCKVCRTRTASTTGVMVLSESFLRLL